MPTCVLAVEKRRTSNGEGFFVPSEVADKSTAPGRARIGGSRRGLLAYKARLSMGGVAMAGVAAGVFTAVDDSLAERSPNFSLKAAAYAGGFFRVR